MSQDKSIKTDALCKQYPGAKIPALDKLSLSFSKGKIYGLLGPNGAGKTTLFSILCGLINPDSGRAFVYGLNTENALNDIKKLIGVVPQQIALYPNLTARENLLYVGRLYHIPAKLLKTRMNHMLEAFGLSDHANKRIERYSGGMKRRANIIAALLHQPELLILDEPTAGVDVQSRNMILDFLRSFNKEGKSIIYTSHLLDEAEKLCDEVAIIDYGRLIAQNTPKALITQEPESKSLEDVFLRLTGRTVRE